MTDHSSENLNLTIPLLISDLYLHSFVPCRECRICLQLCWSAMWSRCAQWVDLMIQSEWVKTLILCGDSSKTGLHAIMRHQSSAPTEHEYQCPECSNSVIIHYRTKGGGRGGWAFGSEKQRKKRLCPIAPRIDAANTIHQILSVGLHVVKG